MEGAAISTRERQKSVLRGIIVFGLTAGIFFILFRRIDVGSVFSAMREIPLSCLILATLLTLSFPVISAVRWELILRSMGYRVGVIKCLLVILGIWPIGAVSPSKIGELLKVYSLRQTVDPLTGTGSVIVERGLDVLVLAAFALLGGISFRNFYIIFIAGGVLILMVLVFLLVRIDFPLPGRKKIQGKINQFLDSLRKVASNWSALGLILVLTVINWFASIVQTKLLFDGVGGNVTLGFTLAALPVAIFAGLLPITIAGMGTRDAAMIALFAGLASNHEILAVSLLYSFFGYWLLAIIGLPIMRKALR